MFKENILIFGDSYSTFDGYVPNGYAVYYPNEGIPCVDGVDKTWWKMLESQTNSRIALNNSRSGSTICNTGYDGDCSKTSSFIFRLGQLIDNGFFNENNIDRVLVFGGTNDSWTGNSCGKIKFTDFKEEDLKLILPGISYFAQKLLSVVEKNKVAFIINTELRADVTDGIIDICNHYGIKTVVLKDIDKINGHPTFKGMTAIKNQVLESLK